MLGLQPPLPALVSSDASGRALPHIYNEIFSLPEPWSSHALILYKEEVVMSVETNTSGGSLKKARCFD